MTGENKAAETLYADKLIKITGDALILHNYYFFGRDKKIRLDDIASIQSLPPGVMNGSWRIWGTSGPGGWLPLDWRRPSRDRIFILHYKNKKFLVGFTAEDSALAENILRQKGLIKDGGN